MPAKRKKCIGKNVMLTPIYSLSMGAKPITFEPYNINKFFPARESLIRNIPAGDGKTVNLFLQCMSKEGSEAQCQSVDTVRGLRYTVASGPLHILEAALGTRVGTKYEPSVDCGI